MINYGKTLHKFLKKHSINIEYITQNTNIDKVTLKNILSGKSSRLQHFEIIAKTLHVPIEVLIGDSYEYTKTDTILKTNSLITNIFKEHNIVSVSTSNYFTIFCRINDLLEKGKTPMELEMYLLGVVDFLKNHTTFLPK